MASRSETLQRLVRLQRFFSTQVLVVQLLLDHFSNFELRKNFSNLGFLLNVGLERRRINRLVAALLLDFLDLHDGAGILSESLQGPRTPLVQLLNQGSF